MAERGHQVELTWKSFLLRPRPSRRTRDEFVAYTQSWERPASMEPDLGFRPWASEDDPPSHSLPGLVAGVVAAGFGDAVYRSFHHGMLAAYFVENRTISLTEVQADVAEAAGIDRAEFLDRLGAEREDATEQVLQEHNEAIENGITAVPTVVIDDALAVPGAQDVETYLRLIDRLIERSA